MISTGENYHQYIDPTIETAKKYLLVNHEKEFFLWTDDKNPHDATILKAENVGMPWATLMRYHLFLQEEERLSKFDYIFYVDCDMLFVDFVGDEILGNGLTATQHPGYAFKTLEEMDFQERMWFYPFERNPQSAAYFPKPEYYFAGGFQGGKTEAFLKAMWSCKRAIDQDLNMNFVARWHDESHWNRYCWENTPSIILDPSYCFPVGYPTPEPPYQTIEVYKRIWGKEIKNPRLLCLTKKHNLSKEGGAAINTILKSYEK